MPESDFDSMVLKTVMKTFKLKSVPLGIKRKTWTNWVDSKNKTLEYVDWAEEAQRFFIIMMLIAIFLDFFFHRITFFNF